MKLKSTEPTIGPQIRSRRLQLQLTLTELASRSNLSVAFLSELERGLIGASLSSLQSLAEALEVSLSYFVPSPGPQHLVRGPKQFQHFVLQDSKVGYSRIGSSDSECQLEPLMLVLPPQCSEHSPHHQGEAFVLVLRGKLKLCLQGQEQLLKSGETVHFKPGDHFTWHNPTDKETRLVWVGTPRMF